MDSVTSQVLLAVIGLFSTFSTALFSYLKYRDDVRIKQIQKDFIVAQDEVTNLKKSLAANDAWTLQLSREKAALQGRLESVEEENTRLLRKIDRLEDHELTCNKELERLRGLLEGHPTKGK